MVTVTLRQAKPGTLNLRSPERSEGKPAERSGVPIYRDRPDGKGLTPRVIHFFSKPET